MSYTSAAQALSGNVDSGAGNAAAATGGSVFVNASGAGSLIRVNGSLLANAIAGVGSAVTGTIADALGGSALIDSASGTVTVTGGVSLDASAFGGESTLTGNGGNASSGSNGLLVTATELTSPEDIEAFGTALEGVLA